MFSNLGETPPGSRVATQESSEVWAGEIFDLVNQYAQNLARKETVSATVKRAMEDRESEREGIEELFVQIVANQNVVEFAGKVWRAKATGDGRIVLSVENKKNDNREIVPGEVLVVENEERFKASMEEHRQELEQLWNANQEIETKLGGAERFAQIQKKVEEIRAVEKQLAAEQGIENEIVSTRGQLGRIDHYAGIYDEAGKLIPIFVEGRERTQRQFTRELGRGEERLKEFRGTAKPKLVVKKEKLLAELRRLAGKE